MCQKCKQVRDANLTATCYCGSAFVSTVGKVDLTKRLALIISVAGYHGLLQLGEYACVLTCPARLAQSV